MTTLLILLSLCTLICSDSVLSHFQNVDIDNDVEVALSPGALRDKVVHIFNAATDEKTPTDSLFDGTVESCAEQCLLTKFFCRSFVLVDLSGEMQCIMSCEEDLLRNYFPNFPTQDFPRARIVGAFNIKEKINNVAEITKAPTLLRKDQFDKLLEGYGFSKSDEYLWGDMRNLLTASLTCLYIHKSTPTNVPDWVFGMELPSSTSKYTHSGEPSRKRTKLDNTPEFDILARLDLFIRGVNRNVRTVYDPRNTFLYIYSELRQLLIWAPNERSFVWLASGDSGDVVTRGFAGELDSNQIQWGFVGTIHLRAANRIGYHVSKFLKQVDKGYRLFWSALSRMTLTETTYPHNKLLLIRDLTYVVSILHGKPQLEYTERIQNSFPGELVDIFTQSK